MRTEPSALLDPAFMRELEVLRRRLEIKARSGGSGEQVSRRKGASAEFHEHRAYAPGDDLRRIDWAAYARSGEPVLKLFRAEEDSVARIALDVSGSLDHGSPSKFLVAQRIAAALGYMALAKGERASVTLCAGDARHREVPASRGRSGLPSLLRTLANAKAAGATDLTASIDALVRQSSRPGLLVVLSDFFDGGPVLRALGRARAAGHDLALVQIVSPDEIEPDFEGDLALEDAETGQTVEVTLDPAALEAYALRFAGLCEELRQFARSRGAVYVRVRSDEPLEPAVRRLVARSVD